MTVDFETKCEQTALDYIKIHLQEGYLVTAYKDVGNYYWESVYKIRASLSSNRKTKGDDDDFQNDSSANHNLRTVEDGDEKPLKGSERLLKGYPVKLPQKSRDSHEIAKTDNSSEKPNNCEYAENPSGDVWECGCFLDTYCEHQIYDRNPDGTINIVECNYEPKDEPQTDCAWK